MGLFIGIVIGWLVAAVARPFEGNAYSRVARAYWELKVWNRHTVYSLTSMGDMLGTWLPELLESFVDPASTAAILVPLGIMAGRTRRRPVEVN